MVLPKLKPDDRFSYADYLTWDDGQRWELINGQACCMTPAPARLHQKWLGNLFAQFHAFLRDRPCEVYLAPFDVRLPDAPEDGDDETFTVVQPDIIVVCDQGKLDDRGCKGAPDLVVEILSPSSSKRDITVKYELYQRHGVTEYWLLYPNEKLLQLYRLGDDGRYGSPQAFGPEDQVAVPLLGELTIDLARVMRE